MKAYIEIEKIGADVSQIMRLYTNIANDAVPGLGTMTFGKDPFSKWVAKITGFDPKYKYAREFLRYKKDYTRANNKGSRGVYQCYLLESGFVYEVKGKKGHRWFCEVDDEGNINEITGKEVDQWIKNHSE